MEEREGRRADLTFEEFVEQHYLPMAKARKKSWKQDEYWIRKRINQDIGRRQLKSIASRDVAQLHLKEKDCTSATGANHLLATIKMVMSSAVKLGFAERNPALGLEKFKEPPPRDRYLSKEELPRFLDALDRLDSRLGASALRLLLFTGMRRNEALSLRWDAVSIEDRRLALSVTKNKRPRYVHLNSKAVEVFRDLAEKRLSEPMTRNSEYVFPSRAGAKLPHMFDLRQSFSKALELASLPDTYVVHDLRRTFGSWLAMGNTNLHMVSKLLGHRTIAVTESTYAHLSGDTLLLASEGIVAMIDEATATNHTRLQEAATTAREVAERATA